jgi:undecaprenyl-diphosphatase
MTAEAVAAGWTLLIVFGAQALGWAGFPAVATSVLAAAGALASQGQIGLWPVLVAGVAGAEVGGAIGWWIGREFADRPPREGRDSRWARRSREALQSGRELEQRVGGPMVLFVPSWVSGGLGLDLRRFLVWNLVAGTLWTASSVLGAYGIGSAISNGTISQTVVPLAIAALALALIVVAFVRWRRHRAATRSSAG